MIMCVVCYVYCKFFFFKQKTAYEMRISDWSSDVCSSDLVDMQAALLPAIDQHEQLLGRALRLVRAAQLLGVPVIATEHCVDKIGATCAALLPWVEIGRASGRERVCQYV